MAQHDKVVVSEGPRPGLLILDMSNDQLKGVAYNKDPVVANIAQLAMSDFFHVCIDSKAEVPTFRAKQKGAQIVDELAGFDHLNQISKKQESALSNPAVLETLKSIGVTHVCVCGTSTDTSVYATAKDLVENGFEIFVVKDATTSKNGKFGHDKGLRSIQSDFGDSVVVGVDDLLGEEEEVLDEEVVGEEQWVEEVVDDTYVQGGNQPTAPRGKPAYLSSGPAQRPAVDEKAEKARMSDAEKLAARKKQVDEARFAHIRKANAEALANADPKRAAEIQKDTAEADKFSKNLPQNKTASATATAPVPAAVPAPAPVPAVVKAAPAAAPASAPESDEDQKGGCCGGIFGRKKKETKATAAPVQPTPVPKAVAPPAAQPMPSSAPTSVPKAVPPPPAAQPMSSSAPTPVPKAAAPSAVQSMPSSVPSPAPKAAPAPAPANVAKPTSATAVPGGGPGQKTWLKPLPEGEKKVSYTPDGAVAQPLGVKKMVQGDDVQERIRGLQEGGISTVPIGPRKMKTPKIVTDTKETWDREGNITREITRYITEIDGTKRTEKEIVKIPAKK